MEASIRSSSKNYGRDNAGEWDSSSLGAIAMAQQGSQTGICHSRTLGSSTITRDRHGQLPRRWRCRAASFCRDSAFRDGKVRFKQHGHFGGLARMNSRNWPTVRDRKCAAR
jgi:hypothetical protein